VNLPGDFEAFHGELELGQKQLDRIRSAAESLTSYLRDAMNLDAEDIFLQGSITNETAIKPDPEKEDGEYDVDLVVISAGPDDSPDAALDALEGVLERHGTYGPMIEPRADRPCVRLRYADDEIGGFHVDLVPARRSSDEAPLEVPRPGEGWRPSAPAEYAQWCRERGPEFGRVVRMLKRWRNHYQSAREAVKSIILQVLIADHFPSTSDDAERVALTLRGIADFLSQHDTKPEIRNPVLPSEVLSDRWDDDSYAQFRSFVAEAAEVAEAALAEQDANTSRELWGRLFGNSFPGPQARSVDLAPGEQDLYRDFGISTAIAGEVRIEPSVRPLNGFRNGRFGALLPLQKRRQLDFKIGYTNVPEPFEVFWKVKNHGREAAEQGGLRGEIRRDSRGRDASRNERTLYTGGHYIEIYIVKDGVCVARGHVDVPIE